MKLFGISCGIVLSLSLTSLSLSACGGGSGSDNAPPIKDPSQSIGTAGIFDIQYGQFSGIYTFLDNGEFYGLHFVGGAGVAGHPHGKLSASNSTASMERISWANFIDDEKMVGAQEMNGQFGRTFGPSSLNVRITGSMGTFSAIANSQKAYGDGSTKTLYKDALPMSVLAGTYTGVMRSVGIDKPKQSVSGLIIDANGSFTVSVASCAFSGKLVQYGVTGVFNTQVNTSGSECGIKAELKGVVVPTGVVANSHMLAFLLNTADNNQTVVFYVSKN